MKAQRLDRASFVQEVRQGGIWEWRAGEGWGGLGSAGEAEGGEEEATQRLLFSWILSSWLETREDGIGRSGFESSLINV